MWDNPVMNRCMICAKTGDFKGGVCDPCKAKVRGEALERQGREKKEADRALHKEGAAGESGKSRG